MFVVDTNILVYAADTSAPVHDACRRLLEEWRRQGSVWYLTWGIVYEFLRVATHPRVFRNPWNIVSAWEYVEAMFASRSLNILVETERHPEIARQVLEEVPHMSGNLLFDAHTAILMREHGVSRIYTRDTHFHRFSFVEVIDPVEHMNS